MIEPLRKTTSGGRYVRTAQTEALLFELASLERAELVRRAGIPDSNHPEYVTDECLLHFIRACRSGNSERNFEVLYKILAGRVLRRLPRAEHRAGATVGMTPEAIRDDVFGRFTELLASDRVTYCEALDFFEVRFEQALTRLRLTARKKAWRHENRTAPLDRDDETGEPSAEVEKAAVEFHHACESQIDDPEFRLRFDAAIEALPPPQGRIVTMIRTGIPIDSQEAGQLTIAKALGKSEKTIRNQRDKAYAVLREKLLEGDGK